MRTKEEIQKDWNNSLSDIRNFEMIEVRPRINEFKNAQFRRQLKAEYFQLLPLEQQLAIYMATKKHDEAFNYESCYNSTFIEEDWTQPSHARYLNSAKKLIEETGIQDLGKYRIIFSTFLDC